MKIKNVEYACQLAGSTIMYQKNPSRQKKIKSRVGGSLPPSRKGARITKDQ